MPSLENGLTGFWKANQQYLDRIYSDAYAPRAFIVDTDRGSRPVQTLTDAESALTILSELAVDDASPDNIIRKCLDYVHRQFDYQPAPDQWPTMTETLDSGKGDCKGLSLLLMTLLTTAGIDSYCAISNGHMWVVAHDGANWRILETDTDPGRREIYQAVGFYDRPLFKIHMDRSYKRKRKPRR